ncbi:MAG: hypothetical protein A3I16_15120 [Burkholderiales bacterium RIFCSPLOWO2_02_FULL_66_35]|nr:MAG: hypothetical protein A3I16_15120 [Burkholderiales bacterium RIFCSPLOWO2_02_FULL_66_35]
MEAESKKVEPLNPEPEKRAVERSTIEFPYLDMQNAFEVADGVHKVGGSGCDWDQLAAHFKQAAQGGGFRMRLITAKLFGLVTYDRGRVSLTQLGLRAADHQQMKAAKVEAFLNVPLYKAVYEKFRGGMLPPTAGLEREMVGMGVAKKQADKARQSFHRSAKFAGFFEFGVDRLVAPSVNGAPSSQAPQNPDPAGGEDRTRGGSGNGSSYGAGGGAGGNGGGQYHPFIQGLLQKLPVPDSDWSIEARQKWLATAANIFELMYGHPGDKESGAIEVKVVKQ